MDRKGTYRFRGVPLNPSEDLGFIVLMGWFKSPLVFCCGALLPSEGWGLSGR